MVWCSTHLPLQTLSLVVCEEFNAVWLSVYSFKDDSVMLEITVMQDPSHNPPSNQSFSLILFSISSWQTSYRCISHPMDCSVKQNTVTGRWHTCQVYNQQGHTFWTEHTRADANRMNKPLYSLSDCTTANSTYRK